MVIQSNYSITQLFVSKDITLNIDGQNVLIHLPCLRDFYSNNTWNSVFFMWTRNIEDAQKYCFKKINNSLDIIKLYIFEASQFKEYSKVSAQFKEYLSKVIYDLDFDYKEHNLLVNGLTITEEIWDYILYLLKLSCGEKVVQPPTFDSEEARALWLAQQKNEEKIRKIKAKDGGDKEGLMKAFLAIMYKFPSFTVDYLFDQTLAQIQWLQKYAAGAVSYEVNAQAYAAGNVKKGKKLDFFIK